IRRRQQDQEGSLTESSALSVKAGQLHCRFPLAVSARADPGVRVTRQDLCPKLSYGWGMMNAWTGFSTRIAMTRSGVNSLVTGDVSGRSLRLAAPRTGMS